MVLGIDPGYGRTGYAAVSFDGSRYTMHRSGLIETDPRHSFAERLALLYDRCVAAAEGIKPASAAVERLFFSVNVKTAIDVAQARGVILLALAQAKIPVFEYTPSEVKSSVTGSGRAGKAAVMKMLTIMMPDFAPGQDDIADAAAVAVTHAHRQYMNERMKR
ncbi:MAG: crossover junction endodeoxyribonuclease RuvC [Spirochaetota bacterium]